LDKHIVAILREHRRRQLEHRRDRRQAAGNAWSDSRVCVHPKERRRADQPDDLETLQDLLGHSPGEEAPDPLTLVNPQ
jgi:hypothetical protein